MARRSKHRLVTFDGTPLRGRVKWLPLWASKTHVWLYFLTALNLDTGQLELVGWSGQLARANKGIAFGNNLQIPKAFIQAAQEIHVDIKSVTAIFYLPIVRGSDDTEIRRSAMELVNVANNYQNQVFDQVKHAAAQAL